MQAGRCLLMPHVTLIAGDSVVVVTHGAMSPKWQQAASGQGYAAQKNVCSAGKHQSYHVPTGKLEMFKEKARETK